MMIWLLLVVLLAGSGTVSASETALFALSRSTLEQFRRSPRWLHQSAYRLMQRPKWVLLTVLLANTAINVAIFAVSLVALDRLAAHQPGAVAVGSLVVLLAVLLGGEIIPKAIALHGATHFGPVAAGLLTLLKTVLAPLLWVLNTLVVEPLTRLLAPPARPDEPLTPDELRLLVEQSARAGVIDSDENEMLQAVVELGEVTVREVMTPRVDVAWVRATATPSDVLATMQQTGHRKLPVCRTDLDDVLGIVEARQLHLQPDRPLTKLLTPVQFVPEQIRLLQLLRLLRERQITLAIVVDEYGGTSGIVFLKDVVRRIVGDVVEEESVALDAVLQRVDDNTYLLPGSLSVREWAGRLALREGERHIDTLAGLVLSRLGRVARAGDAVSVGNLTLTVAKLQGRRIEQVRVHRLATADLADRETSA